ncbi:MAG: hypothetical protein LH616_15385, partial [Ilumatobacteraceae bacterium]|nr:hypothetical protein [Ilumatobacteraceae bacterium]
MVFTLGTFIVGTVLLALTLHVGQGSGAFVVFGLATAAAWGVGGMVSARVTLLPNGVGVGRVLVQAGAIGVALFAMFAIAYQVAKHTPVLSGALDSVLGKADAAPLVVVLVVTLANGLAEELYFRNALPAGLPVRRPALSAWLLYVASTAATGN